MDPRLNPQGEKILSEKMYDRIMSNITDSVMASFASWDGSHTLCCEDCVKAYDYSCEHIGRDWGKEHRQIACPFYRTWHPEIAAQFSSPEEAARIRERYPERFRGK